MMRQWLRINGNSQQILIAAFIGLLAWVAVKYVNLVDAMPKEYAKIETVVELKTDIKDLQKEMRLGFAGVNQSIIDLWK